MDARAVSQEYASRFKDLKMEWYYTAPGGEAAGESLRAAAAVRGELHHLTWEEIARLDDRRSFWINIYNGAVVDRAIATGVEHRVKEIRGFFTHRSPYPVPIF